MHSFVIVICRAYFEAKKRRKYAKNVLVNRSAYDINIDFSRRLPPNFRKKWLLTKKTVRL